MKIESVQTGPMDKPIKTVIITDCGLIDPVTGKKTALEPLSENDAKEALKKYAQEEQSVREKKQKNRQANHQHGHDHSHNDEDNSNDIGKKNDL